MQKEIIKQWDANKAKLEAYFRKTKQSEYRDYLDIIKKIIELVVVEKNEWSKYDATKITEIDNGDYQGTKIFLIPTNSYQPSVEDYLVTHTYYGSCSGCDTLQAISDYGDDLPTESQVKEYMTLALHLVQKMKQLSDDKTQDDD